MSDFYAKEATVLVVEDDPHGLDFMESSLDHSGYRVVKATSAESAFRKFKGVANEKFLAVLTDYRLPKATGLDLVEWIRKEDPTVAIVLITGQGEKAVVQNAMSLGAFAYLEKPATHQELRSCIIHAVQHTRRQRQSVRDRKGLEELEQFDVHARGVLPAELKDRVRVFHQSLHEVGGDFFISSRYSPSEFVLVIGDVSGHDITSGYASVYFQGVFRGSMQHRASLVDFMRLSNHTLHSRIAPRPDAPQMLSLSISAFHIDLEGSTIDHWNYGLPPCHYITTQGRILECPFGNPPLGWLQDIQPDPFSMPVNEGSHLLVFTDGLLDFADDLEVNPFSLLYRMMANQSVINNLPKSPKDDILALEFTFKTDTPLHAQYQPLISEHYAGTEVDHIDQLQANWRRSLTFALDDRLGDRLYDLLICIREGMLNAFIHGCQKAPDKFAHLQISLNPENTVVRVVIDDPGRGHQFDLKKRLEEIRKETGKHFGLGIIQHLSDDFHIENKGTSLVFDFEISPIPAGNS